MDTWYGRTHLSVAALSTLLSHLTSIYLLHKQLIHIAPLSLFLAFSLSRVSERQIQKMRFNCLLEEESRSSLQRLLRCCSEVYIYIYRSTVYTNLPFFNSRTVSEYTPLSFCDEKSSTNPLPSLPFSHFTFLLSRKFPLRPSSRNPRSKTINMSS